MIFNVNKTYLTTNINSQALYFIVIDENRTEILIFHTLFFPLLIDIGFIKKIYF